MCVFLWGGGLGGGESIYTERLRETEREKIRRGDGVMGACGAVCLLTTHHLLLGFVWKLREPVATALRV